MKKSLLRTLESFTVWLAVVLGWGATSLGLVGPHLGGSAPGLPGIAGFAAETIAAFWLPGGILAALATLAVLLRRRWWAAACLAPIVLLTLGPEVWPRVASRAVPSAEGRPTLRIAAVNLAAQNLEDPTMQDTLRRIDADVLVLPEFTRSWQGHLEAWFPEDYPYRWQATAPDHARDYSIDGLQLAIWSRLPPAGEAEILHLYYWSPQIRVPLQWQGRTFAVYGIHPVKPFPRSMYRRAWADRYELLRWTRSEELPMVVAGDFNAPPGSALLMRLRALGLRNASEAVLGYAPPTFPVLPDRFVPFRVAIDHVMVDEVFDALGFGRCEPTSSDHMAVFADIAWSDS